MSYLIDRQNTYDRHTYRSYPPSINPLRHTKSKPHPKDTLQVPTPTKTTSNNNETTKNQQKLSRRNKKNKEKEKAKKI